MRLSLATRRWLARLTAPRRRKPAGKKRHAAAALKAPRLRLLGTRGKLRIYRVDATWCRREKYPDYCMGGHDLVYNWIPKLEVWIADELDAFETKLCSLHELFERHLMAHGMDYDTAHDKATAIESRYRKAHGRGLDAALRKEQGQ